MSRGLIAFEMLIAAAVPAACPMAIQDGIMRAEASASWVAERQRPATSRFSIFSGTRQRHVADWDTLLFNRHGEYGRKEEPAADAVWKQRYEGGPLSIIDNTNLSFINTGSDLILAGALLSKLGGKQGPLNAATSSRYISAAPHSIPK